MNPTRRFALGALALLGLLTLSLPAAAQDLAAAEALFNRGLAEMEASRYETGCSALAESQRLDPRPGTLFTLAVCESRWGHVATAWTRFGDYLTLYETLTAEQQARQSARVTLARKQREKLKAELPELLLALAPGAPAGTVVERNGAVVAAAALGLSLPIDPGEYLLTTRAPGGGVWEQTITVTKGEKKQVTLQVKLAAPVNPPPGKAALTPGATGAEKPPPPPQKAGPSGRRVAAYVTGGVGLGAVVLGGVMGGITLARKGTITAHCGAPFQLVDELACDQTGLDAANAAKASGLVSTIGFAVGGAGLLTAAVLFFTEPAPARPSVGARRRWISAELLSAGPMGAAVGVRGAW